MPDPILPSISGAQDTNAIVPVSGPEKTAIRSPELQEEFDDTKQRINGLRSVWNLEEAETERRRQLRMMKVDLQKERDKGMIAKDDVYIPVRVIHDNITKEAPQFASYLTSSRNTVVFKPVRPVMDMTGSELSVERLEQGFTKLCRYPGWEIPHFRCVDGSQHHGWDYLEVTFDEEKPGHFAVEHVMHERLWFPEDTESLQDASLLVRVYHLEKKQMYKMFPGPESKEQIDKIFYDRDTKTQVNQSLGILYKVYYRREDGIVYTCWLNAERCDWFVREPMPLYRGRKHITKDTFSGITISEDPIFETRYPIHLLPYMVTEDNRLIKSKGRAFLDEYVQEAASSLISSIVNAYHRAITPCASVEGDQLGSELKQLDVKIEPGKIMSKKLSFWAPPYPDAAGLQMVNALLTQNKQEAGQTSFATLNRDQPGDRKTAKEITSSEQQQQMLSTVQVTLYSVFLKDVYTDCWLIASSRMEQGRLTECDIDPTYLQTKYNIYAAGDTEVIQRDETVNKLMMIWPIISQTPAAMKVLVDLLTLIFPSRATEYVKALTEGDPTKQILAGLVQIITAISKAHPDVIPEQSYEQLGALLQAANQIVGSSGPANSPIGGNVNPNGGQVGQTSASGQTQQNANPTQNTSPVA